MNKRQEGPPKTAANQYVFNRLMQSCKECSECGAMSHFNAVFRSGSSVQTNVGGRVMAVRRAMFMAAFPDRSLYKGRLVTSKCSNPNCINPKLLYQVSPGKLLATHYEKGIRNKNDAAAHLARSKRAASKVPPDMVLMILADNRTGKAAANDYGITPEYFNAIKRGESRRLANPFAGLLRAQERRAA